MLSFLKEIRDKLFTLDLNEDNNINVNNVVKYNSNINIDHNLKIYDKIKKCWKKNINDLPKLEILIKKCSQYKLYDFLIDLHKLPFNILEIKNYLLIICIMLMLIFISIIVFSILYFCNN